MRISISLVSFALAIAFVAGGAAAHAQSSGAQASAATADGPGARTPQQRKAADRKLMRRVSAALGRVRGLNATRILVRARNGNVTLAGSVSDTTQSALAAAVTESVDGVGSVTNQLRIDDQPL
ncbi:BON domain-containing protein [Burkholderia ambifaria]|uniref:BON domain-containing protein n=1 Tax=Burkholderia ambifaria TaxID=152480 RepID=UPI000F812E9A|nr:BON domain-containing protein [Burkholderia ambifaria]UEP25813.1 BON domain-containing protein [Burkholderia ambifaria]WAS58528.1 BON domain-containing protein [Burkholderia ambifaria]WDR97736.1 BON domain-containing protein [Burkholderia ambifaria]